MWDIIISVIVALAMLAASTFVLERYNFRSMDIRVVIWFLGFLYGLLARFTFLVAVPFTPAWFLRGVAPFSMIFMSCSFILEPYSFQDLLLMLGFGIGYPLVFGISLSGCASLFKIGNHVHGVDYIVLGSMMAATYPVYVLKVATLYARNTIYHLMVGETVFGTALCVLLVQSITHGSNFISVISVVLLRYVLSATIGVLIGRTFKKLHAYLRGIWVHSSIKWVDCFAFWVGTVVWLIVFVISNRFNYPLNIPLAIFCSVVAFFYLTPVESRLRFPYVSALSDATVFLYLGATAVDVDIWSTSRYSMVEVLNAVCVLFVLLMLFRLAFIYLILKCYSCISRRPPISKREMMILWFAGLTRGGPSVAISYLWFASSTGERNIFIVATTIFIVHLSLSVFGLCTRYLLQRWGTLYQWLGWSRGSPEPLSPV